MRHSADVLARAGRLGVPRIHFGVGTWSILKEMREAATQLASNVNKEIKATASEVIADAVAIIGTMDIVFGEIDR